MALEARNPHVVPRAKKPSDEDGDDEDGDWRVLARLGCTMARGNRNDDAALLLRQVNA